MRVSLASSPPATTTSAPRTAEPPPLEAAGMLGSRLQVRLATLKQSMCAVVGERPPAAQAAPPSAKPATWLRGCGSDVRTVHELAAGLYSSAGPMLPARVLPPIA